MVRDGSALGESGWDNFWDDDSQTPFSFSRTKRQFATFENPKSLSIKADYAQDQGLGGVMLWSLEMVKNEKKKVGLYLFYTKRMPFLFNRMMKMILYWMHYSKCANKIYVFYKQFSLW
jgi:GH18 family chitinase